MSLFEKKLKKEKVKESIKKWILEIDKAEPLPDGIMALNFGLFEPYGIGLTGAQMYDKDDDDWACEEDFVPKERYCSLPISQNAKWEDVLNIISEILGELVVELKDSQLLQVKHITTGFDDGDLIPIK